MSPEFSARPAKKTALLNIACLVFLLACVAKNGFAQENVVVQWNNTALQTIRYLRPGVTSISRALAIVHTCMFDAWSAYDDKAVATIPGSRRRRPVQERTEANKKKAISFAAYRCLGDLYPAEIAKYNA